MSYQNRPPTIADIEAARLRLAWIPPEELINCVATARAQLRDAETFVPILREQMLEMQCVAAEDVEPTIDAIMLLARFAV